MKDNNPEKQPLKLSRKGFLKASVHVILAYGFGSLGALFYSARIEIEWLAIERVKVPIPNLKPGLEGLRIVQMSDFHLPHTDIDFIRKAVEKANSLNPDLVVLTGDYVLPSAEAIYDLAPALAELKARYGVYAILGNHDHWTDAELIRRSLEEVGIPVLVNSGVNLTVGGETLYLAGLDDPWVSQADLEAALANLTTGAPVILLVHEPDFVDTFSQDRRITLQLSGHTHGGQVRLPLVGALILPHHGRKYDTGLYRVNDTWLYVNRGVGVIGPPVRFNCRPEITEFTLVRAP